MKYIITMKVVLDTEEQADDILNALSDLDDDGLFPTGADIRRDIDYQWAGDSDKYIDVCINPQEISNA